jgi:hypothetical protein
VYQQACTRGKPIASFTGVNKIRFLLIATALLSVLYVDRGELMTAATATRYVNRTVKHNHPRRRKLLRKGGWAGAGLAAGQVAGPAGSAAVGAAKYRHDLEAGGRRRTKAVAKIGAPIAAGAIAGPAGTVGYEAVEHRGWIKRHILRLKPHRPKRE